MHSLSDPWATLKQTGWVDFRPAVSDTLLITFSSAATPQGKFTPYLAVNTLPYALLRINGPDWQWYIGGLPDFDTQVGRFEQLLDGFIATGGYRQVAVFGGSKGGFGALEIGLRINSDVIISTGAETVFGGRPGFSMFKVKPPRIRRGVRRLNQWGLCHASRKRRVYGLFGAESHIDLLYAAKFKMLMHEDPILLAGCDHSVPMFVAQSHGLDRFVRALVDEGRDEFVQAHRVEKDLDVHHPEIVGMEQARDASLQALIENSSPS